MISSKKLLKMMQADSEQLGRIVDKMSEDDLRHVVKIMFNLLNEQRKSENLN